jgi:pimeloyl-ACP methyl ester carboxylesterase
MADLTMGEGEPLLLLHGFMGTDATWDPIAEDLASDYMVILPHLRGHGQSTNPSGEFTHRVAAQDVFGLLDALGIERARAAGHSTGGMTLLHMATDQPDRVTDMALLGATTYYPEEARALMRRDMFFPMSIPAGMYDAIPQSYLMVLPNWGHDAIPPEPEGRAFLVSTLKRFYAGDWACTSACANR